MKSIKSRSQQLPWFTLALGTCACSIAFIPGMNTLLEFDRMAIGGGELWRLITSHVTHFDTNHLIWDLFAFLCLGFLAEVNSRQVTVFTVTISAVIIGLGIWILQPQYVTYRGLSGIDSALYGLVVARIGLNAYRERNPFSIGVALTALAGVSFKYGFELLTGDTFFARSGNYSPVPMAHLTGFSIGVVMAVYHHVKRKFYSSVQTTSVPGIAESEFN